MFVPIFTREKTPVVTGSFFRHRQILPKSNEQCKNLLIDTFRFLKICGREDARE